MTAARRFARGRRLAALGGALVVLGAGAALALRTLADLQPLPETLALGADGASWRGVRLLARDGESLNATFAGEWNVHDVVALHDVPPFLRAAFVAAEDKRFFEHGGADWRARLAAAVANVRNGRAVRGASTITEQVVRMLHPRPRTIWSRWLEGFEAASLERRFTKNEILEAYLNQVPYASNRRGIRQAAAYYFARDLDTLSKKEMLALAVLVRAPTRFDLARDQAASAPAIARLADTLVARGELTADERAAVLEQPFALESPRLVATAPHFVRHVRELGDRSPRAPRIVTTLDARVQSTVQRLLDERMRYLSAQDAANGAVLAVDHTTGEVLAWVVAGGGDPDGPATHIDAVTTPRQPGSALKPFLYALALDRGWSAAQIIDDAPLSESTGEGLHSYRNYSRRFYGPVALRDALGNSLNIPALKTLQHVGTEPYLATLASLGFVGLREHPGFYGDGIALGSGAVTLYELVQAYAVLANGGVLRPLTSLRDDTQARPARRVFSAEAASLVANVLADPDARALEFGRAGVLDLPVPTAVKTGTSNDFHDAWAVGFNYRYVVGVWIGNLDRRSTSGVTGATGPALVLRSVLAELVRGADTRPLYLSPRLVRREVCVPIPLRTGECLTRAEWFLPGVEPVENSTAAAPPIRLRQPTPGLKLAYDPRLPAESQVFELALQGVAAGDRVSWVIDGDERPETGATLRWTVARGEHRVAAAVRRGGALIAQVGEVAFTVK